MEQIKKIYKIPTVDYYRVVLEIMSFVAPYSKMRPRQKDVYAELIKKNNVYKDLSIKEKNKLIFDLDTYKEIGNNLNTSVDVVSNVISELRKQGFIVEIDGYEALDDKYIPEKVDIIGFNLIEQ